MEGGEVGGDVQCENGGCKDVVMSAQGREEGTGERGVQLPECCKLLMNVYSVVM